MKTTIAIIVLAIMTSNAYAKKPTSKKPTTKQGCTQLEKKYRAAKKTKQLCRHKLAEQLWMRCGK